MTTHSTEARPSTTHTTSGRNIANKKWSHLTGITWANLTGLTWATLASTISILEREARPATSHTPEARP